MGLIDQAGQALTMALGMFWKTGWSLVLGFAISAVLQTRVDPERIQRWLGGGGVMPVVTATIAGAASSSCSYASASVMRTLFRKGASLTASLAFLVSSTNLVIELGIILYLLLGWQFMAGEWLGGVVMVALIALLVGITVPRQMIGKLRAGMGSESGHGHMSHGHGNFALQAVAAHFVMDFRMLWKDLALGFLIAGAMAAFVPTQWWRELFLRDAGPVTQLVGNAMIGPLMAMASFVCSIGNVPMAAVLWGAGVSFGGVLAFLYGDLIVIPLLDVYRRYFGWRMAVYIGFILYAAMAGAAMVIDLAFNTMGWVPERMPVAPVEMTVFRMDYTFWLNLAFGLMAALLFATAMRKQVPPADCCGHRHNHRNGV